VEGGGQGSQPEEGVLKSAGPQKSGPPGGEGPGERSEVLSNGK